MEPEPESKRHLRIPLPEVPEEAREHAKAARTEMRKTVESLLPAGFVEHRRAARREMLLAMRSLINAALERVDKQVEKL